MDVRIRPINDFMHHADWDELYTLTKHWKSDMEFYQNELKFLSDLVGKHFIRMVSDDGLDRAQTLASKLLETDYKMQRITNKISDHLHQLKSLRNNISSSSDKEFREEHIELDDTFTAFVKSMKLLKSEVFSIAEHVLASEKLKHLLTP